MVESALKEPQREKIAPASMPENQSSLLDQATRLISETVSGTTGELFHRFYEFEDDEEVMTALRTILVSFIGPKMTEKKLKTISRKR